MKRTLWEYLNEKLRKKKEPNSVLPLVHNELELQVGQFLTVPIDYEDTELQISRIEEVSRLVNGQEFKLTDYWFKSVDNLRLRAIDEQQDKRDDNCWLFARYDQFAFSEEFVETVRNARNSFLALDSDGMEFFSTSPSLEPYVACVKSFGGKPRTVRYWDFVRTTSNGSIEVLIVELDDATGWTELWHGVKLPLSRISIT